MYNLYAAVLLALSSVSLVSGGCIDRDPAEWPVQDISELRKRSEKELAAIFAKGCVEDESFMLGTKYGEMIWVDLPEPFRSAYTGLFNLAFQGFFVQKTVCKGEDLYFYFVLLNPFDGGKVFKSQYGWFTAKVTKGQLPDEKQRIDDAPSYLFDYRITKEECPDQVSPFGRLKYPFDNAPILNTVLDEGRIVGIDKENRPIILLRIFFEVMPGKFALWEHGLMLGNPLDGGTA
ncbi:unnamed protein product [Vitrella brassicaformis CCMP3155]|uniref:Uncharacterized protein n=1 Tax=Vitrella brassicaformis (strain CCMP3155) TaxID=1169540 RepID=A0A0G4GQZ9_VITBC|nr:unnamed protein product [Vitrella brassicaformis CCMP3155]|eukprot:CEM32876.1 unnamed protein product [Vitrella brassicaformis CCMP3155]